MTEMIYILQTRESEFIVCFGEINVFKGSKFVKNIRVSFILG